MLVCRSVCSYSHSPFGHTFRRSLSLFRATAEPSTFHHEADGPKRVHRLSFSFFTAFFQPFPFWQRHFCNPFHHAEVNPNTHTNTPSATFGNSSARARLASESRRRAYEKSIGGLQVVVSFRLQAVFSHPHDLPPWERWVLQRTPRCSVLKSKLCKMAAEAEWRRLRPRKKALPKRTPPQPARVGKKALSGRKRNAAEWDTAKHFYFLSTPRRSAVFPSPLHARRVSRPCRRW